MSEAFKDTVALAGLYENSDNDEDRDAKAPGKSNMNGGMFGPVSLPALQKQDDAQWKGLAFQFSVPGGTYSTITVTGSPPDAAGAKLLGDYLDLVAKSINAAVGVKAAEAKKDDSDEK